MKNIDCPFISEAFGRNLVINDDSGHKGITKRLIALVKTQFRRLGESTTIMTILVQKSDIVFISTSGAAILGKLN